MSPVPSPPHTTQLLLIVPFLSDRLFSSNLASLTKRVVISVSAGNEGTLQLVRYITRAGGGGHAPSMHLHTVAYKNSSQLLKIQYLLQKPGATMQSP
jgi:hypothetical protein